MQSGLGDHSEMGNVNIFTLQIDARMREDTFRFYSLYVALRLPFRGNQQVAFR